MTTPNAQAQARWRAKRNAEFQALRHCPNLGADIVLAPSEVSYLLPLLMALRNGVPQPEPPRLRLNLQPRLRPQPEPAEQTLNNAQATATARRGATILHRHALRKPDGEYFVLRKTPVGKFGSMLWRRWIEQIKLIANGRHQQATLQGFNFKAKAEFNRKLDCWEIDGSGLYDTWSEAEAIGRQRANSGDDISCLDQVLARAPIDELRRIRARNHPDHHADADTVLYQSAVQRLDALRNEQSQGAMP